MEIIARNMVEQRDIDALMTFLEKETTRPDYVIPCPDAIAVGQRVKINFTEYGETYHHKITACDLRNKKITLDPIDILNQVFPEMKIERHPDNCGVILTFV